MSERRLGNRYLCADLVRVDWLNGEDRFHTVEAVLEDICSQGACVQVEEAIPLGSTMMLSIGKSSFAGCVCYCVFREYGFFVGIRFSAESAWDAETVTPGHLFDPQVMAVSAEK